ncbi:MAG: SUMF1/EgtB/PvdO family nonheme iron enzyme [Muribaculaceae bacterium]|nr:SUMF1/EgtB/PvdO family nonheme iron enzyme [Muribaculaceae bacterium]
MMKRINIFLRFPLLAFLMLFLPLQLAAAQRGDVNDDGRVNISDVTALINGLLGGQIDDSNPVMDVNADGHVNISDVTALINHLLSGTELAPIEEESELVEIDVNGVTFVMVPVEGGTFMMGATPEQGNDPIDREKPVHQVTLSSYYIGQTEVTQALWQAVMEDNPSYFTGSKKPVEQVTWQECQDFITRLNALTGRAFRLPTEAEWEFAARGGNQSEGYKYAGDDEPSAVAWYSYNDSWQLRGPGSYGPHDVATRNPNELMLFDMSGNVHEWCEDWFGDYDAEAQVDPEGPATGTTRVYRGGSWYFDEWFCRVSFRNGVIPTYRSYGIGLRLAL